MEEISYEVVSDLFMIYNPYQKVKKGRKLLNLWIVPYLIEEPQSKFSFIILSGVGEQVSTVHVNRPRRFSEEAKETGNPMDILGHQDDHIEQHGI